MESSNYYENATEASCKDICSADPLCRVAGYHTSLQQCVTLNFTAPTDPSQWYLVHEVNIFIRNCETQAVGKLLRESNVSVHVLRNFLNELRKYDKI